MSDRVTWETCPICGGRAAVGWRATAVDGRPGGSDVPVEADCVAGCHLGLDHTLRFRPRRTRTWQLLALPA